MIPVQTLRTAERWTLRLTAVLVGLALFARLFSGVAFAEVPAPGLVPICAGGQIVWVDLSDLQSDGEQAPSDPCPYLGLAMLPDWPEPGLSWPAELPRRTDMRDAHLAPAPGAMAAPYQSRAPPDLS